MLINPLAAASALLHTAKAVVHVFFEAFMALLASTPIFLQSPALTAAINTAASAKQAHFSSAVALAMHSAFFDLIANGTIDEAGLETCNETIFAIKTKNAECIAKATADEKCACFAEAAVLIAAVKAGDCKKMGVDANKAMKDSKKKCTAAFAVCNKAEAAASGLINICLGGEDMSATTAAAAATTASARRW
jgi:hypothetical protein